MIMFCCRKMTPNLPLRVLVSLHLLLMSLSPVWYGAAQYLDKPGKDPFKGKALLYKDLLRLAISANLSS